MNRKKYFFFFLIGLIISIIILTITLIKDRTSIIGYTIFIICMLPTLSFLSLYITNDSLTKYQKNEFRSYINNHPELSVISFDINNSNCYIEMGNEERLVFISIFRKHVYLDIFSKEEAKKLKYLESLEDESLKKEGFMNVMRGKKGITLNIKKKSAEDIFFMIKKELRGEKNE